MKGQSFLQASGCWCCLVAAGMLHGAAGMLHGTAGAAGAAGTAGSGEGGATGETDVGEGVAARDLPSNASCAVTGRRLHGESEMPSMYLAHTCG